MAYYTNFTWTDKEQLKKCLNKYVMVARPREYRFALPAKESNRVRMFFDPLSDEPETINNSENDEFSTGNYIVFDREVDVDFLPAYYDYDSYDVDSKVEECTKFYQNKLVVYYPDYKISNNGPSFKNMKIVDVIEDNGGAYFHQVPRIDMDNKRFEKQLDSSEYFIIEGFDNELVEDIDIVVCGDYAYRFKERSNCESFLIGSETRHEAWKYNDKYEYVKVKLSDYSEYEKYVIEGNKTTYLIEDSLKQMILSTDNYNEPNDEIEENDELVDEFVEDVKVIDEEEIGEISETEEVKASNESEITFIKGLLALTKSKNLVYDYNDLVNFHTSIKTNPLTILSGMSGTGKTQLAYNYARMLDLSEDNNTLLFMPISPSYTEPSDILGYLNPMTNEYVPAETGFVDFLVHANNNKNKMHMVIFDEMNLSQVEYWFSPFISILEKDMEDRFLKLYDPSAPGDKESENRKKYPARIKIDDNVIFVGTVNVDETTKEFSDRLLDRTFVINLKKTSFKDVYNGLCSKNTEQIDISSSICSDASIFLSWNKKYSKNHFEAFEDYSDELSFLDDFSDLLSSTIHSDGISHRVVRNIGYFLLNVPEDESGHVINRGLAFDIVVNETIMQKIRGTESQLSTLIGLVNDEINPAESSNLIKLLDKYSNVSKFENVRKAIFKKAEDLRVNGYTN